MSVPVTDLESFAAHLKYANPFDDNRVTQTDSLIDDVRSMNHEAFEELKTHAETLRRKKFNAASRAPLTGLARGVVLSGPAGSGKSHVLARFADWARQEKYPFVYLLNLQAGPEDMLRTILRTTISILSRPPQQNPSESRLFRLVSMAVNTAVKLPTDATPSVTLKSARAAYEKMLEDQNDHGTVYDVLWQYFEDVYRGDRRMASTGKAPLALRWLSGETLDVDEAKQIEIQSRPGEDGCALDENGMLEVLRALGKFADFRDRCFILCFDQVDTLNQEQVQAWSTKMHQLLDLCESSRPGESKFAPKLLVVTSGVDVSFRHWAESNWVSAASWNGRIRQFTTMLKGVSADEAERMVLQRIDAALSCFDSLPEIALLRRRDRWFPLGESWRRATFCESDGTPKLDMKPRDVIALAGAAWQAQSRQIDAHGLIEWIRKWPQAPDTAVVDLTAAIDEKIEQKVQEHFSTRSMRPEELPVDAGNLFGLLQSCLAACIAAPEPDRSAMYGRLAGVFYPSAKRSPKPAFQALIEQRDVGSAGTTEKLGVVLAGSLNKVSVTNMLKRVCAAFDSADPPARVLLISDDRAPLPLTSAASGYLLQLTSRGDRFEWLKFSFEEYAHLEAFEAVVGLAKANDLSVFSDGRPRSISVEEVYAAHHHADRYRSHPLFCELIGDRIVVPPPKCAYDDRLSIRRTARAQLALQMGMTTLELTNWHLTHTQPKIDEECRNHVHALFKEVVLEMREKGEVYITPTNDWFMVLPSKLFNAGRH